MRVKFFIFILFFLLFSEKFWAISFPELSLFPVKLSYSFSLFSNKGKSIDFSEAIQLSEDIESGVWVLWKFKINLSNIKEEYTLTFWVNNEGATYLYSLKDKVYERIFDDMPLVFSGIIEYNKPIQLGKNISLEYRGEYKNFTHPKTNMKLNNVILAVLSINEARYQMYFVKDNGLYILEIPDEIFVRK